MIFLSYKYARPLTIASTIMRVYFSVNFLHFFVSSYRLPPSQNSVMMTFSLSFFYDFLSLSRFLWLNDFKSSISLSMSNLPIGLE